MCDWISGSGQILLFWPDSSRIDKYPLTFKMLSFVAKMSIFSPVKTTIKIFILQIVSIRCARAIFPWKVTIRKTRQDPGSSAPIRPLFSDGKTQSGSDPVPAKFTPIRLSARGATSGTCLDSILWMIKILLFLLK